MFRNKIAIIGPYPPPYGGISIHVQRVLNHLPSDAYVFFNDSGTKRNSSDRVFHGRLAYLKALEFIFRPYRIVHYHSANFSMKIWLSFLAMLGANVYLHIHGASLEEDIKPKSLRVWLFKKLIKHVHIIADNSRIAEIAHTLKPKSIESIDAFLPPKYNAQVLNNFENQLKIPKRKFTLVMCGWFASFHNQDLYGYDLALEALKKLRSENIDVQIIASVNGIMDQATQDRFLELLKNSGLAEFFILTLAKFDELWPLLIKADLFIRPTVTDGNAVSVLEAEWMGTPAIASDVVPRYPTTILFKNKDVDDFARVIKNELQKPLLKLEEKIKKFENKNFRYPLFEKIYQLEN